MANEKQIEEYRFDNRTAEEQREIARKGGKASGKVRQEKATMRKTLEMLLNEKNNKGKTYKELATLGLIKGAVNGNSANYRTIVEVLGELMTTEEKETPSVTVNIVDNSDLEKVMYDEEVDNETIQSK